MGEDAGSIKGAAFGLKRPTATKARHVVRRTKPMRYRSLHHHTTYSYKDGFGLPESHVRRATELNMDSLAVTEHGNVSSHAKLAAAAEQQGVKAIYGCELYTGPVGEDSGQRKNHLTVLAEDQDGYRNLLRMVTQSYRDFHFHPTTSGKNFKKHSEGLIVLSGCTGSALSTALIGGKMIDHEDASYERGKAVARRFKALLGDRYYLEVQAFPTLENVRLLNKMIAQIGEELNIPLVATGDVHYTQPSESEIQQILHSVGRNQTLEDLTRNWGYDVPLSPPVNDKVMYQRLLGTGLTHSQAVSAILSTEEIAQRCNVDLPTLPMVRWPGGDSQEAWREEIRKGWHYRGFGRLRGQQLKTYKEKLAYEMGIIEEKDFIDYFLVVGDIVRWAKDHGIPVGPARGSAAASLVCYCLRITEVNPLLFPGLVFERFIDLSRTDLPDIDLDFDSDRRHEVRDYAARKYGEDCVSVIGTFEYFRSKNSLDDVGRVHNIPKYEVEVVKGLLLERSSGDLRASATIEDTVEQFDAAKEVFERNPVLWKATEIEGNVKGFGVHAAGLVISNSPIQDICAVYERKVNGETYRVVSLDKQDAEKYGLLKIDVLGLNTMSMLAECLRMMGMTVEDLYNIPLDDPDVIDGFRRNDVVGIFQFDGRAMRSVNAELQPDNFKEVCDVNALARPGPLHNNASAEYINIKKGTKKPQTIHPIYDEIAKDTHYQLVYQEQILRIVREIGGFDWTAAAYIRKIISKKLGEQEFNRQWDRFWSGAQENGLTEEQARKIWGLCITAGAYAFNNAHCVSYGMLAWWCMWFKVHHPVEFYVSALRKLSRGEPAIGSNQGKKHLALLRDAMAHGIEAEPPDPALSDVTWTAADGRLVGGLAQVRGVAEKLAAKMVEFREKNKVRNWDDYLGLRGFGAAKVNAYQAMAADDDPYGVHWLHRRLETARQALTSLGLPHPSHTSLEIPYSQGRDTEVTWIGIIEHRNLRDLFESNYARTGVQLDPDEVKDPHLNEWVIAIGMDEEELVTITWDRWRYPRYKRRIWDIKLERDVVLVRGVKKGFQSRRAIYVKDFWVLDMED